MIELGMEKMLDKGQEPRVEYEIITGKDGRKHARKTVRGLNGSILWVEDEDGKIIERKNK
tara:strand:- start:25 stop:204 length:180 start_codon:yes stop_codon:yes gene_type:complete